MLNNGSAQERILIFIPMYNCAAQIGRVINQFEVVGSFRDECAILCIDNRSTDDTLPAAERALDRCSVQEKYLARNDENYGLGGSHKVAFEFARQRGFDYVVVLHGDDQGSITDILPLLKAGVHRQYDALLGARFMRGATLQGYSLLRTTANRVFNLIFSAVAHRRFFDLGSGLNLFRRAIFDHGFHLRYADNLTFNYYLVFGLADGGRTFHFFPINWREDDQISNARLFSQGLGMLRLLWRRLTSNRAFLAAEHRAVPRSGYPATLVRAWPVSAQSAAGSLPLQ